MEGPDRMNDASFVVACTLLVLTWLNMRDMGQLPRRRLLMGQKPN